MSRQTFSIVMAVALGIIIGASVQKYKPIVVPSPCLEFGMEKHRVVLINNINETVTYECGAIK